MQQMAQMQQLQQQLQQEGAMAELARLKAEVAKLGSDVEKSRAESINKRLEAMYSALQSAQIVAQAPGAAVMADTIMRGAGFDSQALAPEKRMISEAAASQPLPQAPQTPVQAQASPAVLMPAEPVPSDPSPFVGERRGIETTRNDGLMNQSGE